jgi:MFS transporter, DHA2 family, multidrug resistance protein
LLFVMPQYFQDIGGAGPLGTGVRLLPMIAGMLAGTRLAPWVIKHTGVRPVIAAGFVLSAVSLALGATTHIHTGYGFAAIWIALLGSGLALALPAAMNAAIGALSAERSGSGSGLLQALRQVGGTIGVAVLGTVLNSGYRGQLATGRLPRGLSAAAHSGVAAGVQVARKLNDHNLLQLVRTAFVSGMDRTLIVCGVLALAGAVMALLFLPRRAAHLAPAIPKREESLHEPVG